MSVIFNKNKLISICLLPVIYCLLSIASCLLPAACLAQIDMGMTPVIGKPAATTMLRDYEAIGVNPSNLGWNYNNRLSVGLGYIGVSGSSPALDFNKLIHFNNLDANAQQDEAEKLFINGNSVNLNANVSLISLSLHLPKFGGIAFSINDRILAHISADITSIAQIDSLFKGGSNGPSISSVFNKANINIQYLREFNLAYGRKIKEMIPGLDLYAGIGYRYILGKANIDLNADNGIVTAQTSLDNNNYNDFKSNSLTNLMKGDGHGHAIDLGANVVYLNKFKFGLSLNNLGFIHWKSVSVQKVNTNMIRVDSLQKIVKTFDELFNQNNLFNTSPASTEWLPAKLRLGAGMRVSKLFEFGADVSIPLNKPYNYNNCAFISLGGEFNLFNFFKISSGISGNPNIGWNIPLGITISGAGWYDIYIATNDILTPLAHTKNPMLSLALCAIRFNIPPKKLL